MSSTISFTFSGNFWNIYNFGDYYNGTIEDHPSLSQKQFMDCTNNQFAFLPESVREAAFLLYSDYECKHKDDKGTFYADQVILWNKNYLN